MKYAFIAAQRKSYRVRRMCEVLEVSASGYYEWRTRAPSARVLEDRRIVRSLWRIHLEARQSYGTLKAHRALCKEGIVCGKHRVARLRRQAGIETRRVRRFRITRANRPDSPAAPNLLNRQFAREVPNQAWVGDMSFIPTRQGFLILAVLLDLYSRQVVGWSMGERADVALVNSALDMAVTRRRPMPGLIHHTDQGQLYAAGVYRERMAALGMRPSMSRKGDAWDNAVAESFFASLKNELTHHIEFKTRDEAKAAIFNYIEVFYNRKRLHQTLGYVSPIDFEQRTVVS